MSKNKRINKKAILFHEHRFVALTNEAAYAIRLEGITWPTVAHYLISHKHGVPVDEVRLLATAAELQDFLRQPQAWTHPKWDVFLDEYLLTALRAKFSQHLDLESMLARTGYATLIYVNPEDQYLGVTENGTGKNMLGRYLMRVRRETGRPLIKNYGRPGRRPGLWGSPVILSHPAEAERLVDLAETYFQCAKYRLAVEAARRAVACDGNCEKGHRLLAQILLIMCHCVESIRAVKKCLRINPSEPTYYWWLSIAHEESGKSAAAVIYANRARDLEGRA